MPGRDARRRGRHIWAESLLSPADLQEEASKYRGEDSVTKRARLTEPTSASALGCDRSKRVRTVLPSTLVRVSTGLLQADRGATRAECFFMLMSSDGLSSKPLRLHPWSWFGANTRPLDGTLDASRAGLLLSVPSDPSDSLVMFFLFYLCRIPPSTSCLHLPSLPKSAVPCASWLLSPRVEFGTCCNSTTHPPVLLHLRRPIGGDYCEINVMFVFLLKPVERYVIQSSFHVFAHDFNVSFTYMWGSF